MKKSTSNSNNGQPEKKPEFIFPSSKTPDIKSKQGEEQKTGEYLNVFEDEDLEFLNAPIQNHSGVTQSAKPKPKTPTP